MRYSAEEFSKVGDRYLGRSYDEMDCQEFVEQCLTSVGCLLDLKGSNAWFRKVQAEGWTGSPEECVREFGCVPKGAFLFIHAFDGGEERRGYHDGKGNASHIGIKTGRGKGAIHSSASKGCVTESEFHDKTIRNGGWNTVGLWDRMDYGKTVNWLLEHNGTGHVPSGKTPATGANIMQGKVIADKGSTVKLRQKPSTSCRTYWDIPVGTELEILESGDEWSRCVTGGLVGWMKNEFIQIISSSDESDPNEDFGPGDMLEPTEKVTLIFSKAELSAALPFLEKAVELIVGKVGRG